MERHTAGTAICRRGAFPTHSATLLYNIGLAFALSGLHHISAKLLWCVCQMEAPVGQAHFLRSAFIEFTDNTTPRTHFSDRIPNVSDFSQGEIEPRIAILFLGCLRNWSIFQSNMLSTSNVFVMFLTLW